MLLGLTLIFIRFPHNSSADANFTFNCPEVFYPRFNVDPKRSILIITITFCSAPEFHRCIPANTSYALNVLGGVHFGGVWQNLCSDFYNAWRGIVYVCIAVAGLLQFLKSRLPLPHCNTYAYFSGRTCIYFDPSDAFSGPNPHLDCLLGGLHCHRRLAFAQRCYRSSLIAFNVRLHDLSLVQMAHKETGSKQRRYE